MIDEKAVEAGQLGQAPQLYAYNANVGYFAPPQLADLARQGRLYLIADAVSGAASGQIAGQYAIKKVIHSFYTSDASDLKERLLVAIQQANADILAENERHPERRPIAAALAVAWVQGNKLLVANVGDNRAYVVWNQDIELLSQEISPGGADEEAKPTALKLLPAQTAPDEKLEKKKEPLPPRQRLSQALGLDREVKINLFARRLFAGDVVVLCSGGLTGYVTEQEIARAINRHSPEEAIKRLMALAGERGNRDPLAISVTRILPSPVTLQPPAALSLPAAPSWDELKSLTKPTSANQTRPASQAATAPMPPIGPIDQKAGFGQHLGQVLQAGKGGVNRWGWRGYLALVLLLLVICGAPLLIWRYLIPAGMVAAMPFLGDVEAATTGEDKAADPEQAAEEVAQSEMTEPEAAIEATGEPGSMPSPQPTGVSVAESNSPIAAPEAAFVSPVVTPTNSPVQTPSPTSVQPPLANSGQINATPSPGPGQEGSGPAGAQTMTDSIVLLTTPTPTPLPVPTIVLPANCENRARFFRDVTIPDGTQFSPGEPFEKVWLLLNARSCPWGPGYTVRFMAGDIMGAPPVAPLLEVVQPEANGEIKVTMVAPNQAGRYRGEWQLHDLKGEAFGPIMYVEIEVTPPDLSDLDQANLTTLYDFVKNVREAIWSSGNITYSPQATNISENLELPASRQGLVVSGIAQLRGGQESANNVLLTYPHQEFGSIQGIYRVDTPLQPTDSLVAHLGFPKLSILSDDGVTFEITFKPDDGSAEWVVLSKTVQYADSPVSEVKPLANVKPGQTGAFTLRVLGGNSLNQDWAIWIDVRLVRQ